MDPADAFLLAVLVFVGAQRVVELVVSRRNEAALLRRGGVRAVRDGLPLLIAIHALVFVLVPAEWFLAPWSGLGVHTWIFLGLALAAAAFRYWAAWSLGDQYTVRVIRVPGQSPVSRGPYRWVRHPIYRAVAVEVAAWPLAFGAVGTAAVLFVVNVAALRHRIRVEEAHWAATDGAFPSSEAVPPPTRRP